MPPQGTIKYGKQLTDWSSSTSCPLRAWIDSGLANKAEIGTSLSMSSTVSLRLARLLSVRSNVFV